MFKSVSFDHKRLFRGFFQVRVGLETEKIELYSKLYFPFRAVTMYWLATRSGSLYKIKDRDICFFSGFWSALLYGKEKSATSLKEVLYRRTTL